MSNLTDLLSSDKWHNAVDPVLVCNKSSLPDRKGRADAILKHFIKRDIANSKFLDYGCGFGNCVDAAAEGGAKVAIGFDIKEQWEDKPNLTTDWGKIKEHAPYDVVMLYDVLDHCVTENPVDVLRKIREVCNGKMYIRCHPWCSRHGTHLYHTLNKAYVHLVFTDEELQEMGHVGEPTIKIIHPVLSYEGWFKEVGLTIENHSILREPVEDFFREGEVANWIKQHWNNSYDEELRNGKYPNWQTEQQFNDFIVR